MRKTCKCGAILSDELIPNDMVYSVYLKEEWKNQLAEILGGPINKFIRTVWHCKECDRFYYWSSEDNRLYTYCIENNKSNIHDC